VKSKALLSLALGWMLCLSAGAQATNQDTRPLSLRESLEIALGHNLNIRIDRYSPQIARYRLRAAYGVYDPVLSLSASTTFNNQPSTFDPKKFTQIKPTLARNYTTNMANQDAQYEETIDSVGPALAGRLPTGLSYNLFARSDYNDARSFPDPAIVFFQTVKDTNGFDVVIPPSTDIPETNNYYATVGIKLSQPLLKDFWIDLYRRNIQLEKVNLKISEITLRQDLMNTVTLVATTYYNLRFAMEQLHVEKAALELAEQLLEDNRRKVEAGVLPPLDQQQAESAVETRRTALFGAEQNYIRQENTMKNLLSDDFQSWTDVTIIPSEDLTPPAELPANPAASWANALLRRPDILAMKLDLEKLDINLRFTYNQLFPSLNVFGSYGWASSEHTFSQSLSVLRRGSFPFYSVGVVFSIPLGNTTARNDHKAGKLAKQQALVQFQRLQNAVIAEVDTAVKLTETTFQQTTSTRKAREFSEDALKAMQNEYRAGTRTSFFVMEAQRDLARARSAEIRALADYNIALAQLALSEGTTLEKNQIELKSK